jgi:hypothetical protein
MMLVTAAIAILIAGARALRELPGPFLILNPLFGLCWALTGLIAIWAALGNAPPISRAPAVFGASVILAVVFAFAANAHQPGWVYVISSMLVYAAVLLASMLVIRSCGYRFAFQPVADAKPSADLGNPLA